MNAKGAVGKGVTTLWWLIANASLSFPFPQQNLYFGYAFQRSLYYSEEVFENEYDPLKPEKETPGAETTAADATINASNPTTTLSTDSVPIAERHLEGTTTQPEVDPQSMTKLPGKNTVVPSHTANVSTQGGPVKVAAPPSHAVLWSSSPSLEAACKFPVGRETFRHFVLSYREYSCGYRSQSHQEGTGERTSQ